MSATLTLRAPVQPSPAATSGAKGLFLAGTKTRPASPASLAVAGGKLQRACACGGMPGLDGECAACRAKRLSLQRQSMKSVQDAGVPSIVHEVVRSPGQPLDPATRTYLEPRFGHDFSEVRVHTDARAAESARSVNALAYTVGKDVVFGAGQYAPGTIAGQRLLAHELTHTLQQRANPYVGSGGLAVTPSADPMEREADSAVRAVETRTGMTAVREHPVRLACQTPDGGSSAAPAEEDAEGKVPKAAGVSKKVCLTFDDGPQTGTEDVLNALGGRFPGTFFLTGQNMASNPTLQKKLVERMLNEGHQIGNHTYTHDPATTKGYEKAYGDLSDPAKLSKFQKNYERNEEHFRKLLGATSPVFTLARLPGNGRFVKAGGKLIFVIATERMGMAHVTWHFEFGPNGSFGHLKASDWQGVKGVAAEVNRLPNPDDIILLHDRHWVGKGGLLSAVINKLAANSFAFGKLDATGKCK